jgi:hypothetical protein
MPTSENGPSTHAGERQKGPKPCENEATSRRATSRSYDAELREAKIALAIALRRPRAAWVFLSLLGTYALCPSWGARLNRPTR